MKMKEFGPRGGRASLGPPLDPPMTLKLDPRLGGQPEGEALNLLSIIWPISPENCMKMKNFGSGVSTP